MSSYQETTLKWWLKTQLLCFLSCWIIELLVGCSRPKAQRVCVSKSGVTVSSQLLTFSKHVYHTLFGGFIVTQPPQLNSFYYLLWHFTQPVHVSQSHQPSEEEQQCYFLSTSDNHVLLSLAVNSATDVLLNTRDVVKRHYQSSTKASHKLIRPAGIDGSSLFSLLVPSHFWSLKFNEAHRAHNSVSLETFWQNFARAACLGWLVSFEMHFPSFR